ncbi:Dolichyl pyrophosphate Man9GlcNAc2 alpha-1,3-glucosyltransferase-like [Aphelenchoides besseyi]|nr:Dolichyl pyrophosphate Man9GlcNAc2 alpha-1,3-glucosyltransferase-like [Aphelenchoides besseyi]
MFGDYEAQRHWMEITINLSPKEWYFNTSKNDLNYWGLDYPPLTAYHSWLCGKMASWIDSSWVELGKSRGHESPAHKMFMRLTVIITMIFLYAPSILEYYKSRKIGNKHEIIYLFASLCYPGLLYVDNGHFQYNHIAMGFALRSFLYFHKRKQIAGSICFVLALNFKQIALYYSLPVFQKKTWSSGFANVVKLGLTVVLTMIVLWLPFLSTEQLPQVVHRIFPMARGLYEDKVASFWCAISPFYKFREFPIHFMAKLSSISILLLSLPTLILLARRPNERNFHQSLFICSMTFFFVVCSRPALMLLHEMPDVISAFFMYPLCVRDNLPQLYPMFVAYYAILVLKLPSRSTRTMKAIHSVNFIATSSIVTLLLLWTPPARYPYLVELLFAEYSFVVFVCCFLFVYYTNISTNLFASENVSKEKKRN